MENMSSGRVEAIWSPVQHDKFIVWGPDITLYEVAQIKDIDKKTTYIPISATRGATVVASQSATGVRCVSVSALADQPDPLLALGYASGKVALATLKQTFDPLGLAGREFVPKYPRLCNSVAWSHTETNMLAVAMDKHRSDHCILLWDVHRGSVPTEEARDGVIQSPSECRPQAEMGLSETAHHVCWANCSNRTLIASMNMKYIKVFDLRDWSNKAVNVGTSRYSGYCVSSSDGRLACTRGDNTAVLWDLRLLSRPLLALTHPRPLLHHAFCPTRPNLLVTLQKDSTSLRLYDIQKAHSDTKNNNNAINEPLAASAIEAEAEECVGGGGGGGVGGTGGGAASALERELTPAGGAVLTSLAWHPAHPAKLLATHAGGIVEYTVCERVTVAWGVGGAPAWAGGAAPATPARDVAARLGDISHLMHKRAQTDYGHKAELWQNAELAEDEAVGGMWHFLALSRSLVEDGCIRGVASRHPGVLEVLRAPAPTPATTPATPATPAAAPYRSEAVSLGMGEGGGGRRVTVYRSAERARALQLCGWGWGWESAGAGVERAEAAAPCRAAALAAFHLRARAAVDVLARARDPRLRLAALALAGLAAGGDERAWRDALPAAAAALPDPYLRALLHFLAATAAAAAAAAPPDYRAVLAETEMRLEDRVAFACHYLDDAALAEWAGALAERLARRGEPAALLLTGVSARGVRLLARWLDRSSDVQTAALVAARCFPHDLLRDPTVRNWIDSYRQLLDRWQLWWARCALDTAVRAVVGAGGGGGEAGEARAVAVACTYCGKSVAGGAARASPRAPLARLPPPAAKMKQVVSCPWCRKPLPRCAVCQLHLGGGGAPPFGAWFAWCVACRHAGHADHLLHWFRDHTTCPVSSCTCPCATLDPY